MNIYSEYGKWIACVILFISYVAIPFSMLYGEIHITNHGLIYFVYWAITLISYFMLYDYGYNHKFNHNMLIPQFITTVIVYLTITVIGIQMLFPLFISFHDVFWMFDIVGSLFKTTGLPSIFYFMMSISILYLSTLSVMDYGNKRSLQNYEHIHNESNSHYEQSLQISFKGKK
jgi:hypothetical protein